VHGLGGSLVNWGAVAPALARRGRVHALDLAGFGRSPLAGRSAAVPANRALLDRFLAEVVREPALLVGNSMGGLISILEAAEAPARVSGLVLVDPAQPRPLTAPVDPAVAATFATYAVPWLGEAALKLRHARLGPERVARDVLALCCVDVKRIPSAVFEEHLELARVRAREAPWSHDAFLEAARSILWVLAKRGTFEEAVRRVKAPALVLHGVDDRLIPVAASRELVRARSDWKLVELADTGHVPQLERPEQFLEIVGQWLDQLPIGRAPNAVESGSTRS
jgi:pimeloyl-ACP methyl ester carboxylesterase